MSRNRSTVPYSSSNGGFWISRSEVRSREFSRKLQRESDKHHDFLKESHSKTRYRSDDASSSSSDGQQPTRPPFDCYPWTDDPSQLTLEEVTKRLTELKQHPGFDEFHNKYLWWLEEEASFWKGGADMDFILGFSSDLHKVLQKYLDYKNHILKGKGIAQQTEQLLKKLDDDKTDGNSCTIL